MADNSNTHLLVEEVRSTNDTPVKNTMCFY